MEQWLDQKETKTCRHASDLFDSVLQSISEPTLPPDQLLEELVEVMLRLSLRWDRHKIIRVLLYLLQILIQVYLMSSNKLCSLQELPPNQYDWEDENHHVPMYNK